MVSGRRLRAAAGAIGALTVLLPSIVAVVVGAAPASAAPIRIMPLGDSITEGYDGVAGNGPGGGYRIELEDDLLEAGISFDFVGSLQNGPAGLADRNHEGHRGYKNADLRAGVPGWVSAAAPDIVLLMAGTNDVKAGSATTAQQAATSFAALLDQVLASAPNARVVVATIPNQWDATANQRVQQYNSLLPGIVSARGPRVSLVDAYQIELYDGLHPSANGYQRLGDIWFTELTRLLASSPPPPPPPDGQWFGSLPPARLLDSRTANSTVDGQAAGGGPIGAGNVIEVQVTGRGGVPTGASAVALNVTAAGAAAAGFATVFPCGQPVPVASNLNFQAGQDIPNAVIAKLGTGGKVCIYTDKTTHLLADVNAWFITDAAFGSLPPARLLDSRTANSTVDGQSAGGGPIAGGSVLAVQVRGRGGVPANATAVALNVTAAGPSAPGFATVFPCDQPVPVASNLNFQAGRDIPNAAIAKLDGTGKVCIYTDKTTHLLADVNAWFI